MKTHVSLLTTLLLFSIVGISFASETIKGNKHIIIKTVSITDYDEISVAGQMEFTYEQSNAAPYFEITIDENVLPYVNIEVKGSKLSVGPKQDGNKGYNLQPSVYKVKTNSKDLKKLNKAGSGSFIIASPIKTSDLSINSAGSGKVSIKRQVTCDDIKISMAGSGSIISEQIVADNLKLSMAGSGKIIASGVTASAADCSLSSSGNITIDGNVKEISYSVAGSGNIKASNCKANQVKSNLTGSGNIELYATDQLSANIIGSGNIRYKGSPTVQSNTKGSGKIKQLN